MSPLRSTPYFWAECDGCGHNFQDGADISAWAQADIALDAVDDASGLLVDREGGSFVVCEKCCTQYVFSVRPADALDIEDDLLADEDPAAVARLVAWLEARTERRRRERLDEKGETT